MKKTYDLSELQWMLSGWVPDSWTSYVSMEMGVSTAAEIPPMPVRVPGSVQAALRDAGIIPDWNVGMDARLSEWVENRHWVYETKLPCQWIKPGARVRLRCSGLDYSGWLKVNGKSAGEFKGSFVPHEFDLSCLARDSRPDQDVRLQIVFDCAPRWLGQFGYTSRVREWKPRFNYTWDWTSRVVQIGLWDGIELDVVEGPEIRDLRVQVSTDSKSKSGTILVRGTAVDSDLAPAVRLSLELDGRAVKAQEFPAARLERGIGWDGIPVDLWYPNGLGAQPLYTLRCQLVGPDGSVLDQVERRIGFKEVTWESCKDAPAGADPWICVVNGTPVFLQGVNWSPIRPNFADVPIEEYRLRLELYQDMGLNVLRVWGGAFLEKECFYNICDELGLMVWQEFPLSSSGIDNWPPEDDQSIREMGEIARSYITRRQHHASLLLWCGGNELQRDLDGVHMGCGLPVTLDHPLIRRFAEVVAAEDPGRRFLPTSSSGPRFTAEETEFGKGLHWDVHGPWAPKAGLEEWDEYWQKDDALFRSETGSPGASPVDIIREFIGSCEELPGTLDNPIWRRTAWWIEWPRFIIEHGREPENLEEYVAWSQDRQAKALEIAARRCKERFPGIGGIILWMGHDCFPCMANTAVVDFWGRPKPAALALREVFRRAKAVG